MSEATPTVTKLKKDSQVKGRAPRSSLLLDTIKYLFRNRSAVLGMIIILLLILVALTASLVAPYDPIQSMIGQPGHSGQLPARAPCIHLLGCPVTEPEHLMGLDLNARDQFSRLLFGSRVSLIVGFSSVTFAILVGSTLGMVAGFLGGWVDNVIMRFMDVLLAFPSLLLAIAIVTVLGPGLQNALLAIALVSIPQYARLARASVLATKEYEYITAVRALGATPARILIQHVAPNSLTPLIVQGTLGIGGAVLEAAALSFLGLGAQPPTPEWGAMLSEARNRVFTSPHLVFYPGLAIMITVLGFNLLGDGMRDALDPRLNRN
ncbi:MAG: ABC transporter permease [Anaerolinea sp.]|nr:ABC transporter permease [Anaerolinea sp.]